MEHLCAVSTLGIEEGEEMSDAVKTDRASVEARAAYLSQSDDAGCSDMESSRMLLALLAEREEMESSRDQYKHDALALLEISKAAATALETAEAEREEHGREWVAKFKYTELLAKLATAEAERDRLANEVTEGFQRVLAAEAEREKAEKLVYVPGFWECPKCHFGLTQSTLHTKDGVITARDVPGEKCPNCDCSLWRTTWKQFADEMVKRCEEQIQRAVTAEAEREALRKDAERYRWLKATKDNDCEYQSLEDKAWYLLHNGNNDELDAAIDAAISAEGR